jgi:hypothetical protein
LLDTFALEKHQGAYETWPPRTRLLFEGEPTRVKLAGYGLRWQFALEDRFLLITDHDCPFEEGYEIYLLDRDLRVLSHHADPPPSATIGGGLMGAIGVSSRNLYCSAEVIDERRVRLIGCSEPPHLEITVLDKRPYGIGRLLRVAFLA